MFGKERWVPEEVHGQLRAHELKSRAETFFRQVFYDHDTPEARLLALSDALKPFFIAGPLRERIGVGKLETIKERMNDLVSLKDEKTFVEALKETVRDLIEARAEFPKEYEDQAARASMEKNGFIPLNERVSYSVGEGQIQLHLALSREVKDRIEDLYRDGLNKLVPIVKANPSIKRIGGTSWLNATNTYGAMKKRLGFELSDTSPEVRSQHFSEETRPLKDAFMTREEFLSRYDKE